MILTKNNIQEVRQYIENNVKDDENFCCPEIIGDAIFVHFGVGDAYIVRENTEVVFDKKKMEERFKNLHL